MRYLEDKIKRSGFIFEKVKTSSSAYIYKVSCIDHDVIHYEVFLRKTTQICIDFEKRIYSETEFKESYPSNESFGVWAWTYREYQKAIEKFNTL